jgi:nicotinate phosphoribosyltransferase
MEKLGRQARGVRIDSGDLVYWSCVAHAMFEEAGLNYMKIVLSNDLNERKIALIHNEIRRSVRDEGYLREISLQVGFNVAKINAEEVIQRLIFGVGTDLATGGNECSLGGVYKLVAVTEDGTSKPDDHHWEPRVKLSAQPFKVTNPGLKRVVRLLRNNFIVADIIALADEEIKPGMRVIGINPTNPIQQKAYTDFDTVETLHIPIFIDGKQVYQPPVLKDVKAFAASRLRTLRLESRRLENPHTLKVSLTEAYWHYKQDVITRLRPAHKNEHSPR